MIKKVKIENYKSVVNQTLELGNFNVVNGRTFQFWCIAS